MNYSKKPSLDYYDNIEDGEKEKQPDFVEMGAAELSEYIERKIENKPKKSTKMYKIWLKEVNILINKFNAKYGNIYKTIK